MAEVVRDQRNNLKIKSNQISVPKPNDLNLNRDYFEQKTSSNFEKAERKRAESVEEKLIKENFELKRQRSESIKREIQNQMQRLQQEK